MQYFSRWVQDAAGINGPRSLGLKPDPKEFLKSLANICQKPDFDLFEIGPQLGPGSTGWKDFGPSQTLSAM